MHRSPLSLAAALASVLMCGTAAAQLRPPLTPPQAQPSLAPAVAPVAQASPVPATPAPASATPASPDPNAAVRQVPSPDVPPAPPPAARASADDLDRPGAVTRALMAAQADGRRAGPGVPLQGPVASAAWKRYIKSFEQPLPQWFGTRIESNSGGSGGGG